jgi:hypothetical protein
MKNIKMMNLSVEDVVWRFYLMMAGTIILGFLGQFFIAAIWAFTLSVSFILGVSYENERAQNFEEEENEEENEKNIPKKRKRELQEAE